MPVRHPEEGCPLGRIAPFVQVTRVEVSPNVLEVEVKLAGSVGAVNEDEDPEVVELPDDLLDREHEGGGGGDVVNHG